MKVSLVTVTIHKAGYEVNEAMIHHINFSINRGELVGMIGPNGAGKSTTIKTLLGLIDYWDGEIQFSDGVRYSYIPERPVFYDELTLQEHIDFVCAVEPLDELEIKERAEFYISRFHLTEHVHKLPVNYSKGMQQKVMLILALITKPDIYIIDEPFMGLDPDAMRLLLATIEEEKKRGAGILMCTHVLDTAERICDRFLLLAYQTLQASGTLADLRYKYERPSGSLYDCYYAIQGDKDE